MLGKIRFRNSPHHYAKFQNMTLELILTIIIVLVSVTISQPRGTVCVGRPPKLLETNPKQHKNKLYKGRKKMHIITMRQKKTATKVMHWNAMGLTEERKYALQIFLYENEIDVCCIQESQLKKDKSFKIRGYQHSHSK